MPVRPGTMHPDDPKPDVTGDELARLLQEGLDPIEPDPVTRSALWRRIARRTGSDAPAGTSSAPSADPAGPGVDAGNCTNHAAPD